MKLLVPDIYQKSIYDIDYDKLLKSGVKCLLFDLDNTCSGYLVKSPSGKLKKLFLKLEKLGFRIILFSNSRASKLVAYSNLGVILHPSSRKPFKKSFLKILNKYNYSSDEVIIIGDQLFTDILGGNRVGIKTCLVDPLTSDDYVFTKLFFRTWERFVFKRFYKKNILIKGEYYE